jgi:hypothetical protein
MSWPPYGRDFVFYVVEIRAKIEHLFSRERQERSGSGSKKVFFSCLLFYFFPAAAAFFLPLSLINISHFHHNFP